MKIKIKDTEITLRYSFRSLIIYEKIAGKSFQPESLSDIIIYFYSTVLGSAKKDFTISYDDFLDWLDETPAAIAEFSQWLADVAAQNQMLANKSVDDDVKSADADTESGNV